MKISDTERRVLAALAEAYSDYEDFCYLGFAGVIRRSGIEDRKAVRRACRSLARKGFAKFGRGLWTEDGEPAGSGYCCTRDGYALLPGNAS